MTYPSRLSEMINQILELKDSTQANAYFETALTRRAWNLEHNCAGAPDHESLEWLGDRILGAVAAELIWSRFPFEAPGQFDLVRNQLTSEEPLARIARELELVSVIKMGHGERLERQVEGNKALSDHVEALIAAAFLAGGWQAARRFTGLLIGDLLPNMLPEDNARFDNTMGREAMTALNALIQAHWKTNIAKDDWDVNRVGGTDNQPYYQAQVTLPDGSSHIGDVIQGKKSEAKVSAARKALSALKLDDGN